MKHFLQSVILLCFLTSTTHAGVTIHYEGYAASTNACALVISAATSFAKKRGWKVKDASAAKGKITRVINEESRDYEGKITGIVIYPHDKCEPLHFQFGEDLFMQDYVKTQFAGAVIHVDIIALFDELKRHFKKLEIQDEGEFWETRDRANLEKHISTVNKMLEDIKRKKPKAKGPVVLPSGRIVDVIE